MTGSPTRSNITASDQGKGGTGPSPSVALPTLVDIGAVAMSLGVTVRHVRRLVTERRIPFLKVGHFVRFDPEEIHWWLDEHRVETLQPRTRSRTRRS
jgi:excisionase family DNA binding protein